MKKSFLERMLEGWGYIKSAAVALTTSAAMGFREYPSAKSADQLAAYCSWVFACVKARSRDVGKIELKLFKVTNRATGESQEVEEHEVLSLLRSVNPFMTFRQLIENTQAYKDLTGEAFWYLVRAGNNGAGLITQIWLLRPDYMNVKTSEEGFIAGYEYKVPGGQPISFRVDEIVHLKEFNPLNPYRGMGVVRAAAVTIDTEVYAEEYNKKFFRNSAVPEVVLSTEQKLTKQQVDRMHAEWANKYGGTQNAHKTAILEGGLEIKDFSISHKDMEFLEGQGFSRDKILALFETPKSRLGMTEGVTVSNAEATINIYLKYLIKPLQEAIADSLTEFLLPLYKGTEDMYFDIEDPVPQDVNSTVTRQKAEFAMGAITPNEIRQENGRDEVPGLDGFYLAINQQTIAGEDARPDPVTPATDQTGKTITHKAMARKRRGRKMPLRLRDMVAKRISHEIKEAVIKSIGARMPSFKKKEEAPAPENLGESTWSKETKEAFWKQLVGKTDHYENMYKAKLIELFDRQEAQVLEKFSTVEGKSALMKFTQGEIESILISVAKENKVAADLLLPLVKQIIEESGSDTMEFLSPDEPGIARDEQNDKGEAAQDVCASAAGWHRTGGNGAADPRRIR